MGTSTTVAGATTTQMADANTTTSGNVNGNEQPTAHPVNGLANDGFGVTYSAASAAATPSSGHEHGPSPHEIASQNHFAEMIGRFDHFWHG